MQWGYTIPWILSVPVNTFIYTLQYIFYLDFSVKAAIGVQGILEILKYFQQHLRGLHLDSLSLFEFESLHILVNEAGCLPSKIYSIDSLNNCLYLKDGQATN